MNTRIKKIATGAAAVAMLAGGAFAASAAFSASTTGQEISVSTGKLGAANATDSGSDAGAEGNYALTNQNSTTSDAFTQIFWTGHGSTLDATWTIDYTIDVPAGLAGVTSVDLALYKGSCPSQNPVDLADADVRRTVTADELPAGTTVVTLETGDEEPYNKFCSVVVPYIDDADNDGQDSTVTVSTDATATEFGL